MNKAPIIWTNVIVFLSTFLIAVIGVPLYGYFYGYDSTHLIATVVTLGFAGMSITVGYHRLWAHKTYEAHPFLQFVLALGGAFALQNSALHWSSDHRVHHKFVDQNHKDPYSAKMGFWYSHIGWMLRHYNKENYRDYSNCRDLQKNKIVMWQHKHYLTLCLTMNFGIPLLIGFIHGDVLGMLLTVGVLRLVLSHHFTFFINSLAHIWGRQPYTDKNTAKDNDLLALITYGEGYHNFHHIFESDYRNGIKWWQFDPSKWFIKTASFVGLTKNLKTVPSAKIKAAKWRMQQLTTESKLLNLAHQQELLVKLKKDYEVLSEKLKALLQAQTKYIQAQKNQAGKLTIRELKNKYLDLKRQVQVQHKQWQLTLLQASYS